MMIKKFRIISKNSEETEFEVSRIKKTIVTETRISTMDDCGNILSPRETPRFSHNRTIDEEIQAISLPSRTPARIEVLEELILDLSPDVNIPEEIPEERPVPVRIDEITRADERTETTYVDVNKLLNSDREDNIKPVILPPKSEVTWVDKD